MKSRISHLLLLLTFLFLIGCSPKTGSGVLSFFFDGVPNHDKSESVTKIDSVPKIDSATLAANLAKIPVYIIHAPYQKRECEACHDNAAATSIVTKSQTSICYKCHTDFQTKYSVVHGPVAGGYCTSCHTPHESVIPKLLKRKDQDLCLLCHPSAEVMKNTAHSTIGESACTQCHNPHGSAKKYMLL